MGRMAVGHEMSALRLGVLVGVAAPLAALLFSSKFSRLFFSRFSDALSIEAIALGGLYMVVHVVVPTIRSLTFISCFI